MSLSFSLDELSESPVVGVGTDADLVYWMGALVGQIRGVVSSNRSVFCDNQRSSTFFHLSPPDVWRELTGQNYFQGISEKRLHRAMTGADLKYPTLPVSFSEKVRQVLTHLVEETGQEVLVRPYLSSEELLSIENIKGVRVISHNIKAKKMYSSKAEVYEIARDADIPVPAGVVASSLDDAAEYIDHSGADPFFVSLEHGAGGSGVSKVFTGAELVERFQPYQGKVLVTEWIPDVELSPNILVLVDPERPHVIAVTDQYLVNKTKYYGNTSPSRASRAVREKLIEYSLLFGELLREARLLGRAGIDFMTSGDQVWFGEGNTGRDNHSTLQNILTRYPHEQSTPLPRLDAGVLLGASGDYPASYNIYEGTWKMEILKVNPHSVSGQYHPKVNELEMFTASRSRATTNSVPLAGSTILNSKLSTEDKIGSSELVEVGRLVSYGRHYEDNASLEKARFYSSFQSLAVASGV